MLGEIAGRRCAEPGHGRANTEPDSRLPSGIADHPIATMHSARWPMATLRRFPLRIASAIRSIHFCRGSIPRRSGDPWATDSRAISMEQCRGILNRPAAILRGPERCVRLPHGAMSYEGSLIYDRTADRGCLERDGNPSGTGPDASNGLADATPFFRQRQQP